MLINADGSPLAPTPAAQEYPDLPIATYLSNAGVPNPGEVAREVMGRVRTRLQTHLRNLEIVEPGAAKLYLKHYPMRQRLNGRILADVLSEMGFSETELATIDEGTKLGLVERERGKLQATATQYGDDGQIVAEESFVEHADRDNTAIKSTDTGKLAVLRDKAAGQKF